MRNYTILEDPEDCVKLGCWEKFVGNFKTVLGFTLFGDFFLQDAETGKIAILYTIEPEIIPTGFTNIKEFVDQAILDAEIESTLFRKKEICELTVLLGSLDQEQVFIPEPYPFLGGDRSLQSYSKGNAWVYADLVGRAQGVDA